MKDYFNAQRGGARNREKRKGRETFGGEKGVKTKSRKAGLEGEGKESKAARDMVYIRLCQGKGWSVFVNDWREEKKEKDVVSIGRNRYDVFDTCLVRSEEG